MAGPPDATMVLFAEKSTVVNRDPNEFGIADTGLKQRALLPFNKGDRIALQNFNGALFTLISRTRCMRPSLTAKLLTNERLITIRHTRMLVSA